MNVITVDFKAKKICKEQSASRVEEFEKIRAELRRLQVLFLVLKTNQAFDDHASRCLNSILDAYISLYQK